jgi:ribosomal protein S18 acetylase RimI-like enzyme
MTEGKPLSEIHIVPMTPADYDDVRALWMTIRGFGIRALDDSREDIERFILRNPTTSVVARDGNRIVGSILCGSDGRQGALYHVCVAKDYRRRGIGTQMVAFCMHQLRYMGINKVSLIAFTRNDVGNAFWNKIGWTRKTDVNYYEFVLNEENITQFIGDTEE